jgi:hypothetical protein
MEKQINKDNLRNTNEPYALPLNYLGLAFKVDLSAHIDNETRTFKRWHLSSLQLLSANDKQLCFKNSNGNISFVLTIQLEGYKLLVSCNCDRRVEMLCHHAYAALKQLILENGADVFLRLYINGGDILL